MARWSYGCADDWRGILQEGDGIGSARKIAPSTSCRDGRHIRVFVGRGDVKSHAMKRHLWALSEALVPTRHVFDFNQALMDLGAMICVARNPKCLVCPMTKDCRSFPFKPDQLRRP